MTETPPPGTDPGFPPPPPQSMPPPPPMNMPAYPTAPGGYPAMQQYDRTGPVGQIRSTGTCILLAIVTLGIYSIVWYYKSHDEMKRHTGQGLGGGVALILTLFVGIVMPYITSSEVGDLYERRGQAKPVSGATGLWYFPGIFILVGPIIWFVKTNGALNDYWRSQGAS